MDSEPKDLGAVAVDGTIKYELLERDASHVKLRNILEAEQYIVIDLQAIPGSSSTRPPANSAVKDRIQIRSNDL
jgi:hypothetical protein